MHTLNQTKSASYRKLRWITWINLNAILRSLLVSTLFILGLLSFSPSFHLVHAQTTVTASVPDNTGPTTPILISPTNGSRTTDGTPSFIWQRSTDTNGIGYYQLRLDGSTLFNNIPTTATNNANYTLTYNSATQRYTLTPKATITDGTHTWQVRVFDTLGNGTNSATWSFTIDTLAPSFVISNFGELAVSISAQDAGTIPTNPLVLEENEPLIVATGEANSSVSVVLTIPGDPTQNFSTTVNSAGNWNLQLGILPRDVTMTLDFTITDQAGNVSVLSDLDFLIESDEIVFPPVSPSPTASGSASPSPSVTPSASTTPAPGVTPSPNSSPTVSPSPSAGLVVPTPRPQVPRIRIPVIPPREVANEIRQEIVERVPRQVKQVVEAVPEEVRKTVESTTPYSGVLVSAALPAASAVAIGAQFGGSLSFTMILRILQALGLIPAGKPQGLVFNSRTYEPVPFALLTITNPDSDKAAVTETVVTDVAGVYRGIRLAPDRYQIQVSHQDYRFPSKKSRPNYIQLKDFYKGELFEVESQESQQLFLIPIDPLNESGSLSWKTRLRVKVSQLSRVTTVLLLPLFVVSGILALLFPSIWNNTIFALYSFLLIHRTIGWFRPPIISGTVLDQNGQAIQNAVIRLRDAKTNQLSAVLSTDKTGSFSMLGKKAVYEIIISKPGYVWENESSLSSYEIDATESPQELVATMKPVEDLYDELFS